MSDGDFSVETVRIITSGRSIIVEVNKERFAISEGVVCEGMIIFAIPKLEEIALVGFSPVPARDDLGEGQIVLLLWESITEDPFIISISYDYFLETIKERPYEARDIILSTINSTMKDIH